MLDNVRIIVHNKTLDCSGDGTTWEKKKRKTEAEMDGLCQPRHESYSLGGYESRWKIEFGFEYFTGNHERRHLEEGISISFACTVYMY